MPACYTWDMVLPFLMFTMLGITPTVRLLPRTSQEFKAYLAKMEVAPALAKPKWPDFAGESTRVEPWSATPTVDVYDGLVHDWVAARFVRGITAQKVLDVLAAIDRYPSVYGPDVRLAKLVSRSGTRSTVTMRLSRKNIILVVLDAEFAIETTSPGRRVWSVISRSSNIWELDDPDAPNPRRLPAGTGSGFLWNLNSYWLIEERAGGVYLECRAISLTRRIPTALAWAIKPMVTTLPRQSLEKTLRDTVRAAAQ